MPTVLFAVLQGLFEDDWQRNNAETNVARSRYVDEKDDARCRKEKRVGPLPAHRHAVCRLLSLRAKHPEKRPFWRRKKGQNFAWSNQKNHAPVV